MPTIKEAEAKRRSYNWMIHMLMEEKERAAKERMAELHIRQAKLKPIYEDYLKLYDKHIKPLMKDVDEFCGNLFELRKIEHFLQGQAEHRENEQAMKPIPKGQSKFERLPYASKTQVGKKPEKKSDEEIKAQAFLDQIKDMDPKEFNRLMKLVNGG